MDLRLLEARWRIGMILTSDLRAVAAELSAAGHDAPAVDLLAAGRADARETFERALVELGGGGMAHDEAALLVARSFAEQVVAHEIPPDLTAKAIGLLRWKGGPGLDDAFVPFARLDERYETAKALGPLRGLVTPLLDRRVRTQASMLLGRGD